MHPANHSLGLDVRAVRRVPLVERGLLAAPHRRRRRRRGWRQRRRRRRRRGRRRANLERDVTRQTRQLVWADMEREQAQQEYVSIVLPFSRD